MMKFTIAKKAQSTFTGGGLTWLLPAIMLMVTAGNLAAVDIVAVTRSGARYLLVSGSPTEEQLSFSIPTGTAGLDDPIVDVEGLDQLSSLKDLRIYHAPQIDSFAFLAGAEHLERLVISFARVRDIGFLRYLPSLRVLLLEFCDDWDSGGRLPFLDQALDLSRNSRIEFIGFRLCGLDRIPRLSNAPDTLAYLDLSYNSISLSDADASALNALRGLRSIVLHGNPTSPRGAALWSNISMETGDDILKEYLE